MARFLAGNGWLFIAGGWAVVIFLVYLFFLKDRAGEEATTTLQDNAGVVEAGVIRQYHKHHKWYPRLAFLLGLAGPVVLAILKFAR